MDKIDKNLLKIPAKHREKILQAATQIKNGDFEGLDLKKLKNSKDLFRVRVGDYRIIFKVFGEAKIIIAIQKRDDQTYKGK